eukprot:PhF_6_TR33232/c0_g1_i1/m.48750
MELFTFLALLWATAARPADLSKVMVHNIMIDLDGAVKIRFVAGKTTNLKGKPYTVHSCCTPEIAQRCRKFIVKQRYMVFEETVLVKLGICRKNHNKRNKNLTTYSFRRGLAIAMAQLGTDITIIQKMLGHATVETTKRYLNWGWWDLHMAHQTNPVMKNLSHH